MIEAANQSRLLMAQADVSTGEVQVMQREGSDALHQQLAQLEASELLWSGEDSSPAWCPDRLRQRRWPAPPSADGFRSGPAAALQPGGLDGLGLPELPLALRAIGGLLRYLRDTQPLEDDAFILASMCRRSCTAARPWCSMPRPGATSNSPPPSATDCWRAHCSGRSIAPSPAMGGRCLRRWLEAC